MMTLVTATMKLAWPIGLLVLCLGDFTNGATTRAPSRPTIVNIGAIFTFDSTIGRAAKVAIDAAVDDVNASPHILKGTQLNITKQDTNCSGFLGIVKAFQFMETTMVAIIGPQSSVDAHVISHIANELRVPLLSFAATDPTLSSLQYPFFVRTVQSDLFQMTAVAEIVDYYHWKQVIAIFVDDDYGRNGMTALGEKLAERRCKIAYKAAIPPGPGVKRNEIQDVLIRVSQLGPRVIVLHTNPDSGFLVLSEAKRLHMMDSGNVWIATDWLSSFLDSSGTLPAELMDSMQGILVLRQHTADSVSKKTFISRWNTLIQSEGVKSFGLNAYGLYAYDTVWTIAYALERYLNEGGRITFSNDSRLHDVEGGTLHLEAMSIFDGGNHFLRNIKETNFNGLTGEVSFDSDGNLVHPSYDIINVVGTGHMNIGYWSNYSGLSVISPESLYLSPPNHSSTNQRLLSVIWPGRTTTAPRGWYPSSVKNLRIGYPRRYSFKQFVYLEGVDTVKGFCIDVFKAAIQLLPYELPFEFVPIGDGKENPSYAKLTNLVAENELDGAVGDIAIVPNRTRIIDFTQPFIESGLVIVAPIKKLNSGQWSFLRPFTIEMWGVTAVSFLVVGVVVWILEHRFNDDFRGSPRRQLVTVLWFSFSTAFFAHRESTVSCLGRMVLLIWLFVVLIIQSSYTASLTSILTVQQLSSSIKGIESLKTSDDKIGFQVGSFAENYLIEEIGIAKSRLVALGSPEKYADALTKGAEHGGVAAIVDELPYIQLFLSTQCKFKIVGQEFTKSGWGFAFPRDSPLAVELSTAILQLSENGDLQRIHEMWLRTDACNSSQDQEVDANRLHLTSFWGLFLICGITCFLALFIYFMLIIRQFNRQHQEEAESSSHGGSTSNRIQSFLSFADEKQQEKASSRRRNRDESVNGNTKTDTSPT